MSNKGMKGFGLVFVSVLVIAAMWYSRFTTLETRNAFQESGIGSTAPVPAPGSEQQLKVAYGLLEGMYTGSWSELASTVALYGSPDEATDAIIDAIQNREDRTAENTEAFGGLSERTIAGLTSRGYLTRLRMLGSLGLTKTERAEDFLLEVFNDPHSVVPNVKHRKLRRDQAAAGNDTLATDSDVDLLTWSFAVKGLILLNEPKYSLLLDEETTKVLPALAGDPWPGEARWAWEDFANRKAGMLLDILVFRDALREHGAEYAVQLLNDGEKMRAAWGTYSKRYVRLPHE